MNFKKLTACLMAASLFFSAESLALQPKKPATKRVLSSQSLKPSSAKKLAATSKSKSLKTKPQAVNSRQKIGSKAPLAKAGNGKNRTQRQFGVKGIELNYVKVQDKKLTYREKGKMHTTIGKAKSRQYGQVGLASYYGGMFHGRKTASGEIYNKNAFTAAHKTLALGSYALVTNLRNGRKVIVRINDRGPFSGSRILDLSVGSARELGMLHSGVAKVRVEALQVDKQGYISGKGTQSLLQLAKKAGLPLKIKGEGESLAIKAAQE